MRKEILMELIKKGKRRNDSPTVAVNGKKKNVEENREESKE